MAFQCSLLPDVGFADSIIGGDQYLHNIHIGYDDERDVQFFLLVSLQSLGEFRELTFALAILTESTGDIAKVLSARKASLIIPKHCKPMVRLHLMSATHDLIGRLRPNQIMMSSIEVPLVAKAESKYDEIASIATKFGYQLTKTEVGNGQKIWWMELPSGGSVATEGSDEVSDEG